MQKADDLFGFPATPSDISFCASALEAARKAQQNEKTLRRKLAKDGLTEDIPREFRELTTKTALLPYCTSCYFRNMDLPEDAPAAIPPGEDTCVCASNLLDAPAATSPFPHGCIYCVIIDLRSKLQQAVEQRTRTDPYGNEFLACECGSQVMMVGDLGELMRKCVACGGVATAPWRDWAGRQIGFGVKTREVEVLGEGDSKVVAEDAADPSKDKLPGGYYAEGFDPRLKSYPHNRARQEPLVTVAPQDLVMKPRSPPISKGKKRAPSNDNGFVDLTTASTSRPSHGGETTAAKRARKDSSVHQLPPPPPLPHQAPPYRPGLRVNPKPSARKSDAWLALRGGGGSSSKKSDASSSSALLRDTGSGVRKSDSSSTPRGISSNKSETSASSSSALRDITNSTQARHTRPSIGGAGVQTKPPVEKQPDHMSQTNNPQLAPSQPPATQSPTTNDPQKARLQHLLNTVTKAGTLAMPGGLLPAMTLAKFPHADKIKVWAFLHQHGLREVGAKHVATAVEKVL